jgi:hypothetical protein
MTLMQPSASSGLKQNLALVCVSLFTSGGTLICCALPALFVSIGAGAALAGLVSNVPQIVWVSQHKEVVFGFAGFMLALASIMQWRARSLPCPADPQQAKACMFMRHMSFAIYLFSLAIFLVGVFFAFMAPLIF